MTFDHELTMAIGAFAKLEHDVAMQALKAEAELDYEIDEWIEQYIADQGGDDGDDARYDALHAEAQETPAFEEFRDKIRAELLDYFEVTEEHLALAIVLRSDDSEALWAAVNEQRQALGTGVVLGDL